LPTSDKKLHREVHLHPGQRIKFSKPEERTLAMSPPGTKTTHTDVGRQGALNSVLIAFGYNNAKHESNCPFCLPFRLTQLFHFKNLKFAIYSARRKLQRLPAPAARLTPNNRSDVEARRTQTACSSHSDTTVPNTNRSVPSASPPSGSLIYHTTEVCHFPTRCKLHLHLPSQFRFAYPT
jgi:hypothetical protein